MDGKLWPTHRYPMMMFTSKKLVASSLNRDEELAEAHQDELDREGIDRGEDEGMVVCPLPLGSS